MYQLVEAAATCAERSTARDIVAYERETRLEHERYRDSDICKDIDRVTYLETYRRTKILQEKKKQKIGNSEEQVERKRERRESERAHERERERERGREGESAGGRDRVATVGGGSTGKVGAARPFETRRSGPGETGSWCAGAAP